VSETIVRTAVDADLPSLTDLYNHYVLNTPATLRI
jgi:L-amino acid N-acyltransferase YncA